MSRLMVLLIAVILLNVSAEATGKLDFEPQVTSTISCFSTMDEYLKGGEPTLGGWSTDKSKNNNTTKMLWLDSQEFRVWSESFGLKLIIKAEKSIPNELKSEEIIFYFGQFDKTTAGDSVTSGTAVCTVLRR